MKKLVSRICFYSILLGLIYVLILKFLHDPEVKTFNQITKINKIVKKEPEKKEIKRIAKKLNSKKILKIEKTTISEISIQDSIQIKRKKIPAEGKVFLTYDKKSDQFKFIIKNKGLCMKPLLGIASNLEPEIGVRFLYWNQFGLHALLQRKGFLVGFGFRPYGWNFLLGFEYNLIPFKYDSPRFFLSFLIALR